jgi:hypothetical protein
MSENVKPGWQTTEFWLTVIAGAVSMVFASGIVETGTMIDKALGIVAIVLASLGYSVSRGLAKRK